MMVATMTLEIAATEFVDAAATRFADRRLGPATVTRLAAAITSCTNTSSPSVMLAAGLLARKAKARL
jgi:aconitase A